MLIVNIMRASTICETKIKKLTALFLIILLLETCGAVRLDPLKLKIAKIDMETVRFPPSVEELAATPKLVLPASFKDETATESRLKRVSRFFHIQFEKHGNLKIIPAKRINDALSKTNARKLSPDDIAETIELGKTLNASFISRIYMEAQESVRISPPDRFKVKIKLVVFRVDSGQMLFSREVLFDSQNLKKTAADLKKLIERSFPVRAFVLETRGGRRAAKISAGRSLGIALGRKFKAAKRKIRTIDGKPRSINAYSPTSTVVEVIKIMENDAWVEIKENDRNKIRKGQALFTLPED